jgi:hypothetical protein
VKQRKRPALTDRPSSESTAADAPYSNVQTPPSDQMIDAYRDTVLHLRHCGLLAAPRLPEMRVLWRCGSEDRRLVSEIAERWELAG